MKTLIIIILSLCVFNCADSVEYTEAVIVEKTRHKFRSGEGRESCLYKIAVLDSAAIPTVKRDKYYYDCSTQVGDTVLVRIGLLN